MENKLTQKKVWQIFDKFMKTCDYKKLSGMARAYMLAYLAGAHDMTVVTTVEIEKCEHGSIVNFKEDIKSEKYLLDKLCEQMGHATMCPGTCNLDQEGHYCEEVQGFVSAFMNI